MNLKPQLNPFLYGTPVPPSRHIGRRDAVRTLLSRLYNGESTAIVGEPHIGKSSLLRYIADESVRREWLGKMWEQHLFVDIDCHLFPVECKPDDFWQQVLARVKAAATDGALKQQCEIVVQNNFGSFTLEGLFKLLAKKEWRVVLLIDEFDALLNHPNFTKAEFFGALRSLATRTDALVVITASRLSVAQMNRKSREINPYGSPFFNNVIEVRLLPLARDDAQQLIATTLQRAGNAIAFSPDDCAFLFPLAGRHPFLLQVAGASLFDAIADGKQAQAREQSATQVFHRHAAAHFEDFWRHLAPNEQRALLLLALAQYRGYVDKRAFDLHSELGKLEWFAPDLRRLRDLGIVESEPTPSAVRWQNENWRIAAGGIVPWLMDNVVSGTRDAKDFGEWLRDKEFQGLLTREEVAKLKEIAGKIPKGAIDMATEFVKSLFRK
jgi:hypothetical protein